MARSRQYQNEPQQDCAQWNDDPQSRGQYAQEGGYDRDRHGDRRAGQGYGDEEFSQSRLLNEDFGQDYGRGNGSRGPGHLSNQGGARGPRDDGQGGPYRGQGYDNQSYGNRQGGFSGRNRFMGAYGELRRSGPSEERGLMERAGDEISSWFGDDDAERRREIDHRGKGPKGYTRSDDRISDDVNDYLSDDSWLDASDIEVSVDQGEVTLTGHVESRQSKRRAEDCADRVAGVKHVQNNLRVKSPSEPQTTMDQSRLGDGASGKARR